MFSIRPNEDRLIVKPQALEDKTPGGLWIPENAKGNPRVGRIVAVGSGKSCPHCGLPHGIPDLKEGMIVTWPESAGSPETIGGESYLVLRASDIQLFDPESIPS
jgi:chaperonin GroES